MPYKSPGGPPDAHVLDQLHVYAHPLRRSRGPSLGAASELALVLLTACVTPNVRSSATSLGLKVGPCSGASFPSGS